MRRKGEEKRSKSLGRFKVESFVTTGMRGEREREPWQSARHALCTTPAILATNRSEKSMHDLMLLSVSQLF